MKILIVSDTHGRDENLEKAVYREEPFDYLIHCGDVEGGRFLLKLLWTAPAVLYQEIMISFRTFQGKKLLILQEKRFW